MSGCPGQNIKNCNTNLGSNPERLIKNILIECRPNVEKATESMFCYLKNLYGADSDLINFDALEVTLKVISGASRDAYGLRYNNLYTYMVFHGILVPYCEWIYEERFEYNGIVFCFDTSSGQVVKKERIKTYTQHGMETEMFGIL